MIERLERMLAAGQDSAPLRFGLGNAYLHRDPALAAGTSNGPSRSTHVLRG